MRDRLERALKKSKADYTEIRIEDTIRSGLLFRGEELDGIGSSRSLGGLVRALVKGGWGIATFNDLDDLEKKVEDAYDCARLTGRAKSQLAEVEPVVDSNAVSLKKDFREVPLAQKKALFEEYNNIIRTYHDKIQTTAVSYSDQFTKIWYANSEGTYIEDERSDIGAHLSAIARDGDDIQRAMEGAAGCYGFEMVETLHQKAEEAAKRAIALLAAPPVVGGKYAVVLNQTLAGVFAHEAFGHLSEADHVYESDKMKELMVMGKRFGPDILNIIDDGSIPGLRGTHKYDDEGVKTRENYLLREGVLVGRLHSRETAAKMGEPLTGNARAQDYQHEPLVRMTNTYIDNGNNTFEDMVKDIKLGVYAHDFFGGQTMMEMFTFSATHAYMIRNGQICELVRDVVLTGNLFETLMNIDMTANDLEFNQIGTCGKGGQGVPVTDGSPHIRIQNVIVGGG